ALTAQKLNESLDDFPEVRGQFTDNQQQDLRHEIILNYFEKDPEEFNNLLEVIKTLNPKTYNEYVHKLESNENPKTILLSPSDSKFINELKAIFSQQQDELFWQCTKQVYQEFLWEIDEYDLMSDSGNLGEYLLLELEDLPEETILLEFVPRLVAYLSIKDITKYGSFVDRVKNIAKENISRYKNIKIYDFNQQLKKFKKNYKKSSDKAYLLIKIKEKQAEPNSFQISGWFATDEIIENPDLDLKPLNNKYSVQPSEDHQIVEKAYKLEEIKEIVRDYRLQIINYIVENNDAREFERLIVEIFLPSSLLYWDIEQWEVDINDKTRWTSLYEVRIRSLDRLTRLEYTVNNKLWKNKWALVKNSVTSHENFLDGDFNGDLDLVNQLQNKKKLGLKLKSVIESSHERIALALCKSGTPIAIWFRSTPPEGDCESQLNCLLQDQLLQLSERVFQARSQPKCHISLIWDDPNRLIPNYQLK
ncbi:MAG: hypothetical protein H0X31_23790, partial [Nostocaceae cyanobacterium]|nr:hypothetical protein [Nostocaceae cyanobacterium]